MREKKKEGAKQVYKGEKINYTEKREKVEKNKLNRFCLMKIERCNRVARSVGCEPFAVIRTYIVLVI